MVQSEVDGRVFDAAECCWTYADIDREAVVPDAAVAAAAPLTTPTEGWSGWARVDGGWEPVEAWTHPAPTTNYERAEAEWRRLQGAYYRRNYDARMQAIGDLRALSVTWAAPGSPAAEQSGLLGIMRVMQGENGARRRGVITLRDGTGVILDEQGQRVPPEEALDLGHADSHPLYEAARAAGYRFAE